MFPIYESPADGYPVMICLHGNGATGSVINNAPYNLLTDHIRELACLGRSWKHRCSTARHTISKRTYY